MPARLASIVDLAVPGTANSTNKPRGGRRYFSRLSSLITALPPSGSAVIHSR